MTKSTPVTHLDDRLREYFDVNGFTPVIPVPPKAIKLADAGEGGVIVTYNPMRLEVITPMTSPYAPNKQYQ